MTEPHRPHDRTVPGLPSARTGARVIDLPDPGWCWNRLRGAARGVLSARSPRRPVSLEVGYTLDGEQVLVPLASDHASLPLLADGEVTLELSGRDDEGLRWVVRVTGAAVLSSGTSSLLGLDRSRSSHPAHGRPADGPSSTLLLRSDRVRGYYALPLGPDDHLS